MSSGHNGSGSPIPSERALPTADVLKQTLTGRVTDKKPVTVVFETAASRMLAQCLTSEAMFERLKVLEPFTVSAAQEETVVNNLGIESEEALANVPIYSSFQSTDRLTVTGNSNTACPGPVFHQKCDFNGHRKSAVACPRFQGLETNVYKAGSSSTICYGPPVTGSDVSREELCENTECNGPMAGTMIEGQDRVEAHAVTVPTKAQSVLTELAQQDIEKETPTPDPESLYGRSDRRRDRTMLDFTASADAESPEIVKAHLSTPSPRVYSRGRRSSNGLSDKDKQGYGPTPTSSKAMDLASLKTNQGRLESATGVLCKYPGKRGKQPGTKRKRVARSENVASKNVNPMPSVECCEENLALEGTLDVHPLPLSAGPLQKGQRDVASRNVQQKPDINTKAQSAPRSQAPQLLQSSISEARAQDYGRKAHHDHPPQESDRKQNSTKSFASEQTRDEGTERKLGYLDRSVKTPLTQVDENMSKSKCRRMKARKSTASRLGNGIDDGSKQHAKSSGEEGCFAINCDPESGPILAPGEGLVTNAGPLADVHSLRNCIKTTTEINVRDGSKAGSCIGEADGLGDKSTATIPQASSTSKGKKRVSGKQQNYTGKVPAPVGQVRGNGDARSKDISNGSGSEMVRGSGGVLAASDSRRENSPIKSTQHQQLPSTINIHTDFSSNQSSKTIKTTPSRTSLRRVRANKTNTAIGNRPGAGDSMSTSRGSVPGARARSHLRSSNQDENAGLGRWPSRTPSVASNSTSRRPRGFQPAEVGKSKPNTDAGVTSSAPPKAESVTQSQGFGIPQRSNSNIDDEATSLAPPKAETITQPTTSTTTQSPPNIESSTETMQTTSPVNVEVLTVALLAQTPDKQSQVIAELLAKATPEIPSLQRKAQPSQETTIPSSMVQTVTMGTSRPEQDPTHLDRDGAPSPSDTSSVQVITNDEPQQSCWSRAVTTEAAPPTQSGWDNSTNPIDNPAWTRSSTLPTPDYKGPVPANLHNLPPYKLVGSKDTGAKSTSKKTEATPSSSFSRQLTNMQQATLPSQPARTPQPQDPIFVRIGDKEALVTPESKKPSVHPTTSEGTAKIPPHLRAQGTSLIAGVIKDKQVSNGEIDRPPPHLRHSVGHLQANNKDDEIKAGMTIYTPPPRLQARSTKKLPPASNSPLTAGRSIHQLETTPAPTIDIDEELAAAEQVIEAENDAQIVAAIAAGEPHGDQQFAAGLQAGYNDEQVRAKHFQMGIRQIKSEDRVDTLPPHLRASKQKQEAPALDRKPQQQSPAAIQSAIMPQENNTSANSPHSVALKDVTKLRQNGIMRSPSQDASVQSGTGSAVKKGKKPANEIDSGNGVSNLIGWDGKMVPALLGEDWEARAQLDRHGQDKLAGIKTWTEDHAVNPKAGVVRVEDKLMSPIRIKHPVTKPNPDEFNQAKRHLNTDDHIQAYKAKHSSSVGNTTPSSRGRMTKEEKRDARKRHAEEERNRVYPPNEHAPAANIYLRPAEFKDMRQVCFLHNHYVLKTACAHDLEETNELYWRQRLQETIDEGDPFLVAVHMGSKPINNIHDVHRKKSESIVGFAFAADYGLQTHAYRFTVELEMWVHRDHLHQGIGRSMLDRMLAALDPGYNLLECAPFLGGEGRSRWVSGSHCVVKTILVNILHNEDNKKDVEWKKDWLSNKNDFKYCGTLPGIGHKFNKDVDIAQMILRTSAAMPASPIS